MAGHEHVQPDAKARNPYASLARRLAEKPVKAVVDVVDEKTPWLSPNHITFGGTVSNGIASVLAAKAEAPKDRIIAAIALGVTGATDGIDGTLARRRNSKKPGSHNSRKGAIYDATGDRAQELFQGLARVYAANKRGDKLGKRAAQFATITNPISSDARAFAGARGINVPEGGMGARFGRAALAIVSTAAPEVKGTKTQAAIDFVSGVSNLRTFAKRLSLAKNGEIEKAPKDGEKDLRPNRTAEKERLKAMLVSTLATWGATAVTELMLKEPDTKKDSSKDKGSKVKKTLALGAVLSLGVATYLKSRERGNLPQEVTEQKPTESHGQRYLGIISEFEDYSREHKLQHLYVGGAIADFEGKDTQVTFDHENMRVYLINHPEPSMIRSDGTVKDMDIILMTRDQEKIKAAREYFAQKAAEAKQLGLPYPQVSIESIYYPEGPNRKAWKQFVSAQEVDEQDNISYVLGETSQQIPWETMAPWTYVLEDGTEITGRNPVAQAIAYSLRVPSGVKKKDLEPKEFEKFYIYDQKRFDRLKQDIRGKTPAEQARILANPEEQMKMLRAKYLGTEPRDSGFNKTALVGRVAHQLIEEGKELGIDYKAMYKSWIDYTIKLHNEPDFLTFLKGLVTEIYWDTIGTQVAHGAGFIGKLSSFNDKMAG